MIDELTASPMVLQVLLIVALVTRLDILIVIDKAGAPVRSLLERGGSWGKYLSTCPWCVGVWCGAGVVAAWVHAPGFVLLCGLAALAALCGGVWGAWLKSTLPPPQPPPE